MSASYCRKKILKSLKSGKTVKSSFDWPVKKSRPVSATNSYTERFLEWKDFQIPSKMLSISQWSTFWWKDVKSIILGKIVLTYAQHLQYSANVPTSLWVKASFLDVKRLTKTGLYHFVSCTNRTNSNLKIKMMDILAKNSNYIFIFYTLQWFCRCYVQSIEKY